MNSVLTALRVFEAVAESQPAGLSELARQLGVPKSTVQRCLRTLEEAGWTRSGPRDGRWTITAKALTLGSLVSAGDELRECALPELSALQRETGETIHLAVPDGDELVLIERLDSSHQLRAFLALGTRLPLHAAATGKAYLASLPDDKIDTFLASRQPKMSTKTETQQSHLWEEVRCIRVRGYATTDGELHEGIAAVAVALRDSTGSTRACFSISGPSSRLTPELFEEYGVMAMHARDRIERSLR